MDHYAGIDVSLEQSSVCVVDGGLPCRPPARYTIYEASPPHALLRFARTLEAIGPVSPISST
jgi:hypothetical protein